MQFKNVNNVWIRVLQSGCIFVGQDNKNLTEAKQRTTERAGIVPAVKNEEIAVTLLGKWNDAGQLLLRQEDPLPLGVVSIILEVATGD